MYAPSPLAFRVVSPHDTSSETILAFQAPPDAVIAPVTHEPKIPGPIRAFQTRSPRKPILVAISRRSLGMPCAPPITLNKRYHWGPRAISSILPQLRLSPSLMKPRVANGNRKL